MIGFCLHKRDLNMSLVEEAERFRKICKTVRTDWEE